MGGLRFADQCQCQIVKHWCLNSETQTLSIDFFVKLRYRIPGVLIQWIRLLTFIFKIRKV